ncbi:hypothetical protein RI103_19520 [Paraburkholderia sp. FT54]|uniref:hypothetical protein n=1 Tax=Paraburkholderia sp. FT54 TaxID=3074437 RepID=UPI00287770B8|nr:hypothetical protein [Paraburkholderia sp. FT54]WNC93034.1 hypothetical protein RI103_19520 [Paraburkholderia sp. FT54]
MSSLNIRQNAVASLDENSDTLHRASLAGRKKARQRTLSLTVASGAIAAIAIAVGLPSMGIAVYLAATLPFAFFS